MEPVRKVRKQGRSTKLAEGDNLRRFEYSAGMAVPQDGVYRVRHGSHRVPHEVTLLSGSSFPPCSQCGGLVAYELVRAVSAADTGRFHVTLHQLPVLDEDEQSKKAS